MKVNEELYQVVASGFERWIRKYPEGLQKFSDVLENSTVESAVENVQKRTPVGIEIAVRFVDYIFSHDLDLKKDLAV